MVEDIALVQQEWAVLYEYAKQANDIGYADFVCRFSRSFYLKRIRNIDFINYEHVLDVGCGYGQWTYALANSNLQVTALERNKPRLEIAKKFLASEGLSNVKYVEGDAVAMPFEDATFDALFCYGVFMFLPSKRALVEFHRVLKPGGKLYVCTNGSGWWLKLFMQYFFKNFAVSKSALRSLLFGKLGAIPSAFSRKDVLSLLRKDTWRDCEVKLEGNIGNKEQDRRLCAYEGKYMGLDAIIEFVATKR